MLDNTEKKSDSTLFKDERVFYTFQFHTTLLSNAHNNNIYYVLICNFQISIIMVLFFDIDNCSHMFNQIGPFGFE